MVETQMFRGPKVQAENKYWFLDRRWDFILFWVLPMCRHSLIMAKWNAALAYRLLNNFCSISYSFTTKEKLWLRLRGLFYLSRHWTMMTSLVDDAELRSALRIDESFNSCRSWRNKNYFGFVSFRKLLASSGILLVLLRLQKTQRFFSRSTRDISK